MGVVALPIANLQTLCFKPLQFCKSKRGVSRKSSEIENQMYIKISVTALPEQE